MRGQSKSQSVQSEDDIGDIQYLIQPICIDQRIPPEILNETKGA